MYKDENPVVVRNQIGRVFKSNNFCDTCTCGKVVCKSAVGTRENKLIWNYFLGICPCGNIFITFTD